MTVAAVILAASPDAALADADGTPAVRRIADAAWAGGATPVVVVAADPAGLVAPALATGEVTLVEPTDVTAGPAGQIARGIEAALALVAGTGAALVWPARLVWADAETVTTLIEAHGDDPAAILQPAYGDRPGWPVLVPASLLAHVRAVSPDLMPADVVAAVAAAAGVPVRLVDTGDPGTTHDVSVARAALPAFSGPPEPDDGVVREWGAPAVDQPDDAPPAGAARRADIDPAR